MRSVASLGACRILYPSSTMSHYQILQTPDYVVLVMEAVHDARIIFLDGIGE